MTRPTFAWFPWFSQRHPVGCWVWVHARECRLIYRVHFAGAYRMAEVVPQIQPLPD